MSKKDRRGGDRRPAERSDSQPDDEQRRQPGEPEKQEGDSLTALKAILGKVAALLPNLKLKPDESVTVVEQLYGSVLEMDLKLAGETDDKRKASVLAHIKNTKVDRVNGKIAVKFPNDPQAKSQAPAAAKSNNGKGKTPAARQAAATSEGSAKDSEEAGSTPAVDEPAATDANQDKEAEN